MFWRMTGMPTTSPVESVLDRETYTLEELLDEDELIQECKSLNFRLINFLRGKAQVQQLLHYVVDEPPEGADDKRTFKFPFVACEVFTCEVDAIFKTLVQEEELMDYLFSFLDFNRPHSNLQAGYFSKVVICLLVRETVTLMHYLQAHQDILKKLVDLIGITSIMEILDRLVGADDCIYTFHFDAFQWLADTNLLEMLVDKLHAGNSSDTHANAAEVLSAVTRCPQSSLALKLASSSFVDKLFYHVLEDPGSKSALVHSLSVCISLLDPNRGTTLAAPGAARGQHTEILAVIDLETVEGMLQKLGDLLKLLEVSSDENILPTSYGELRPPLGTHRLKIVEFIAVLLRTNNEDVRKELVRQDAIKMVVRLFFEYPFNNMLHHHVENIIVSCIESNSSMLVSHLFVDCDLVERLLVADQNPLTSFTQIKMTVPVSGKAPPRIGNIGHITKIANKLVHVGNNNIEIQAHLKANKEWIEWQSSVLRNRNTIENVYQWTCGRPTAIQDRLQGYDSDEDEFHQRNYVSTVASNLTREIFRYNMFENEDAEEGHGSLERSDEDAFFDDESAEVVLSSLRLGEEQDSTVRLKEGMFTNSNWFAFQDDRSDQSMPEFLSSSSRLEDWQLPNNTSTSNHNSDDEVVVGEDDDLVDTASSPNEISAGFSAGFRNGFSVDDVNRGNSNKEAAANCIMELSSGLEKVGVSDTLSSFGNIERNAIKMCAKPPDWAEWQDAGSMEGTSGRLSFNKTNPFEVEMEGSFETTAIDDGSSCHQASEDNDTYSAAASLAVSSLDHAKCTDARSVPLFEETVQFLGVEIEGTAKGMDHALKEGIVGEAGPIHPHTSQESILPRTDGEATDPDFNDVNYWRSDYDQSVAQNEDMQLYSS